MVLATFVHVRLFVERYRVTCALGSPPLPDRRVPLNVNGCLAWGVDVEGEAVSVVVRLPMAYMAPFSLVLRIPT